MAESKAIVYCKYCGTQYIMARDYGRKRYELFIERTASGEGRRQFSPAKCVKCEAALVPRNLKMIQMLF